MDILESLDQDEFWTDGQGHTHRIAQMEPRYCRNVIAFLQRRADELADAYGLLLMTIGLPGESTQAYLSVTDGISAEMEVMADPIGWLNEKPLLQALQHQVGQDEGSWW